MNYSNNRGRPIKKGRMNEVVKPKKRLFSRQTRQDKTVATNEMQLDLVRILTDLGIVLSNTRTISGRLIDAGWVKHTKIEKDTH